MSFKQSPNNHPEIPGVDALGRTWESNPNGCWCRKCNPKAGWFIVCAECGNKRCPKAKDHDNACTNSNALGQKGSEWEKIKPWDER